MSMNVSYLYSLLAVVVLGLIAYAGAAIGLEVIFGIVIPYLAILVFFAGFINKVLDWAKSPVPFRITTTCGQQQSYQGIFKQSKIDNPSTTGGVIIRMLLEVLLFRSLFRNTRVEFKGKKVSYKWVLWLWLFAILFHYSFLVVLIRHLRFFVEPTPFFVTALETVDGMLQIGLPGLFLSGVMLLGAAILLLGRRILLPKMNYISRPADYFPLFLIIGIALTGLLMRHFTKVDIVQVKELTLGLAAFHPGIPEDGVGGNIFYVHLFYVSLLFAYIPFSKIMHAAGIFLSPTRNLANNNRMKRHINPWNPQVKIHTYEAYEEDFRDKMKEAGIPVEKE